MEFPALDPARHDGRVKQQVLQRLPTHPSGQGARIAPPPCPFCQSVGRAVVADLPFVEQDDLVAASGVLQDIGGPDQAGTGAREVHRQLPDFLARNRIDPDRRLVQQHQPRRGDHCAGHGQLLPHPARELAGRSILERRQAGEPVEMLHPFGIVLRLNPAQPGIELKVLADGQFGIERPALRHIADLTAIELIGGAAQQFDRAAIGRYQPGENPHQRGLAASVRANQAKPPPGCETQ